jgi:hypothetical protein
VLVLSACAAAFATRSLSRAPVPSLATTASVAAPSASASALEGCAALRPDAYPRDAFEHTPDTVLLVPAFEAAYRKWADERIAALRRQNQQGALRIERIWRCGNCEEVVAVERIQGPSGCQEGRLAVTISEQNCAVDVDARIIPKDCCEKPCQAPSPTAWMLRYLGALEHKDLAALRALVHPTRGLRVRIDGSDDTLTRARLDRTVLDRLNSPGSDLLLFYGNFTCNEDFRARTWQCILGAGGFGGTYTWEGNAQMAYVVEVEETNEEGGP